jgi:hypothetical protein
LGKVTLPSLMGENRCLNSCAAISAPLYLRIRKP